jgi:MATE family multidrug resistance protein
MGIFFVIDHLEQTPEVVRYAKPYLNLLSVFNYTFIDFQTFKQFAEGLGFTKQAMFVSHLGKCDQHHFRNHFRERHVRY